MGRKIVFFDIDGTLWDWERWIPDSTIRAIKELREAGHLAFICSGRSRSNIRAKELLDLGFDGIIAACGCHIEYKGQVVNEFLMSPELIKLSVDTMTACRMPFVLEGPHKHWISNWGFGKDIYIDYLFKSMGEDALYIDDDKRHEISFTAYNAGKSYEECLRLVECMPLAAEFDEMILNKFSSDVLAETDYPTIKSTLSPYMDFIEHGITPDLAHDEEQDRQSILAVIEAVPKGYSKGTGIKWICDYLGIDMATDTYAIGDSANDIEMLETVAHGVAMGNGTAEAKAVAEYVTTDLRDDGIYNALKHYELL